MNEVSESKKRRNLVIKRQIDMFIKIIKIAEKGLKRNLMGDLTEYQNKKNIEQQIRTIVVYMSYIDGFKQTNVPLMSVVGDKARLRKIEQDIRKKFQVPNSIPVIYNLGERKK